MYEPQARLRILRQKTYGVKAMERRLIKCCADNPQCLVQDECKTLYDSFLDTKYGNPSRLKAKVCDVKVV